MWDFTINGVDFYHIANWFYIYSFLGWLWETCYVSVPKGKADKQRLYQWTLMYHIWLWCTGCIYDPSSGK